MEQDYKMYLEEKFKGLTSLMNAHNDNVLDRLEAIEEQTKKTNGRVSELERKETSHVINCPQTPKIQKIEEELLEYKIIKKYPKLFVIGSVCFALISIILVIKEFIM